MLTRVCWPVSVAARPWLRLRWLLAVVTSWRGNSRGGPPTPHTLCRGEGGGGGYNLWYRSGDKQNKSQNKNGQWVILAVNVKSLMVFRDWVTWDIPTYFLENRYSLWQILLKFCPRGCCNFFCFRYRFWLFEVFSILTDFLFQGTAAVRTCLVCLSIEYFYLLKKLRCFWSYLTFSWKPGRVNYDCF